MASEWLKDSSSLRLRPSITLLHYFICRIIPAYINYDEPLSATNVDQNFDSAPCQFIWNKTTIAMPTGLITTDSAQSQEPMVVIILHILSWLFSNLLHSRCTSGRFMPPFPPPILQLSNDSGDLSDNDDNLVQDSHLKSCLEFATPTSANLSSDSPANDFISIWPSQITEVFTSLQQCLPSLALLALKSMYDEKTVVELNGNLSERVRTTISLATLHHMLAFVKSTSANSMILLNSVLSQFPGFLRDLWWLCETLTDRDLYEDSGFIEPSNDRRQKGKLFELIASGEITIFPPKIEKYTAIVFAFADCLRHRLLCLTDLEINGKSSSNYTDDNEVLDELATTPECLFSKKYIGCGFSPKELLNIGQRLRDFMIGLINLAHPPRQPSESELKASLPCAYNTKHIAVVESEGSLSAALKRVQKRADICHGGSIANYTTHENRFSETLLMLRWELHRWSTLFSHIQLLVMQIYDWDQRSRRPLASFESAVEQPNESVASLRHVSATWLKPGSVRMSQLEKLPHWLRKVDNFSVALAKAPFGYFSLLNPDKDDLLASHMSYSDWRQMTTLMEMPFVVEFQRRVEIFQSLVRADRQSTQSINSRATYFEPMANSVHIRVRRNYLYEDAFENLSKENAPSLRPSLNVVFINQADVEEMGVDGGGLSREFITQILQEGFNPNRGFFLYTGDNRLYPNPNASNLTPDYLQHYYFLGRVLGKAIYEGMLVEVQFAHFFLAKVVSRTGGGLGFDYLYSLDSELYRQLCMLKTYPGNVRDLELDFTTIQSNFGESTVVELKPGGSSISVTDATRVEYVHLVANYKLNKQIYPQSKAFIAGMSDVVYLEWLRLFDAEELQVLISGADIVIDVEDLRQHTVYVGDIEIPANRTTIDLFWHLLSSFTVSQKRSLLCFATACSRPPMFGFRDLHPPFAIQIVPDTTRLPTSSTCMNLLKLPAYADIEVLTERLLYALNSNSGFEFS